MKNVILVVAILLLQACSNPAPMQLAPDTYVIMKEDHAGVFGSHSKLKMKVYKEAQAMADAQGRVIYPLSMKEKPMGNGPGQWATVEYHFMLLEPSDPRVGTRVVSDVDEQIQGATDASPVGAAIVGGAILAK
jgi:hypothetical protein